MVNGEKLTITLEGREFPVSRLSILKMRTVVPAMTKIGVDTPEGMDAQRTVLVAAMQSANPEFKVEEFDKLAPTLVELTNATIVVRDMITGRKPEELVAGEPQPETAPVATPAT